MKKNQNLLQNKTVAIIGGGPGGLTLARLLQMKGVEVKVYERDLSPAARVQGTCLDLHETSGRRALREAGLIHEYFRLSRSEGDRHLVMDKKKQIKLNLPPMHFITPDPEIDRGDLRRLLLESLKPETVLWNHHFKELMKTTDGKYLIHFEEGLRATADLVIGSDGARSKVRPYVTDIKPRYSGITWIETEISNSNPDFQELNQLIDQGSLFVFGDQKALLLQEKADGHTMTYFTGKVPESELKILADLLASPESANNYLNNYLRDWDSSFAKLLKASNGKYIVRPIFASDSNQSWKAQEGLTLIGDAAHVMPPFAGQGANMAMLDAVILADALTEGESTDLRSAIQSYEHEMFQRTSLAMRQTQENEDIFYLDDAADVLIGKMLGPFRHFSPVIPFAVKVLNRVSDFWAALGKKDAAT